jgi:hypothetical protein
MLRSKWFAALFAGVALTCGSVGITGFFALRYGEWLPGMVLLWPAWGLLAALPCFNVGTPEQPRCEGTPIHLAAAVLGVALAFFFYAVVAYALLTLHERRARGSLPADA